MVLVVIVEKTGVLKELNLKDFNIENLYKKAGFKTEKGFEEQTTWKINKECNIVLYGKYSIQFIIWWTITIISCCFLAIKCFVEYIYINILKVCAIILELCDNTFPENPMKRTIMDRRNQEPYIMRYYLVFKNRNLFPFNVFIHKILKSDDDKDLHDHPWDFFHLILSGGYWEEIPRMIM